MLQNRKSDPAALARAIAQWLDRPLVLVGLMGVGKSTVGRRLAADLGIGFVDADEEIEKAAQMSIAEIFEKYGEPYFRDGERRVISRLIDGVPRVIATGGGAFMNDETRALILQGAIAIWLDADLATLVERVSRRNTRPLLRNGNPADVLARLAEVRNPVYAHSQIHVRSKEGPHNRTVHAILEELTQWHA
jgi:shikimate kinase